MRRLYVSNKDGEFHFDILPSDWRMCVQLVRYTRGVNDVTWLTLEELDIVKNAMENKTDEQLTAKFVANVLKHQAYLRRTRSAKVQRVKNEGVKTTTRRDK